MTLRQRERLKVRIRREMHKQIAEKFPGIPPYERRQIVEAHLAQISKKLCVKA